MMFSWEISFGQIITSGLTLIAFAISIMGFFYALRGENERLADRLGTMAGRMINIETELRELAKAVSLIAVQEERLTTQAARMNAMQKSHDEWRQWVRDKISDFERAMPRP